MELAGLIFEEKHIEQLPAEVADRIRNNISDSPLMLGQAYIRNQCHNNAILAAQEIKVIEGLVRCDDGFLFEHYWNSILIGEESCDFDVTIDVIGSDVEKNTPKAYFEYNSYSLCEIKERRNNTLAAFSTEIDLAISQYYEGHPLRERYYKSKEQVG